MRDIGQITTTMARLGFRLSAWDEGTMDSGSALYTNETIEVVVWKDRSQWLIGDSRQILEPMGYWRAYDDIVIFCDALTRYTNAKQS